MTQATTALMFWQFHFGILATSCAGVVSTPALATLCVYPRHFLCLPSMNFLCACAHEEFCEHMELSVSPRNFPFGLSGPRTRAAQQNGNPCAGFTHTFC